MDATATKRCFSTGIKAVLHRRIRLIAGTGCLACVVFVNCTFNTTNSSPVAPESKTTGEITGKIFQNDSKAKIFIEQGRPVDSTIIDPADGFFTLSGIPAGIYRVRIAANGFDTFSAMIRIEPGFSYDIGGIGLAELNKNFNDSIPSIYDTYPATGSEVIYLPPDKYSQGSAALYISVSFDRPMNRESVEKALSISPALKGGYFVWYQNARKFTAPAASPTYSWDGAGLYDADALNANGRTLEVTTKASMAVPSAEISTYSVAKSFTFYFPRSQCFTDTTYEISISRDATDTSGTPLDSALTYRFKTVQSAVAYKAIEMLPHNGDDWVPLISTGISLTFPRRMDQSSAQAGIIVNLKAKPEFLWQDYNHLLLYVGGFFVPDTTYQIIINGNITDLEGKQLGAVETLSFQTQPIGITQTQPVRGQVGVGVSNDIGLTYNTYMDRSSFASRCILASGDGDTVPGAFNYRYSASYNTAKMRYDTTFQLNQICCTPSRSLKNNTMYTFTVAAGVKDLNGFATKEEYRLQFITVP